MLVRATLPAVQLKRKLQDLVNEIRDERLSTPFVFDGVTYDADEQSVANLIAVVAAVASGIPLPEGFVWRSSNNQNISHDEESLKGLAAAMCAFRFDVYARSFALKDALEASESPAKVDVTKGWPVVDKWPD